MKLGVVDDNEKSVKQTLQYLQKLPNTKILFTAANGYACLQQFNSAKVLPQLIITDIMIPKVDGCNLSMYLKKYMGNIKVLVLSAFYELQVIEQCLYAGADGFLFKGEREKYLQNAMNTILHNNFYVDERIVSHASSFFIETLIKKYSSIQDNITDTDTDTDTDTIAIKLTKREKQFLHLCSTALNYDEIATLMFIDKRTAETYYNRIAPKVGVQGFKALALFAIQYGYTTLAFYNNMKFDKSVD
jgi:DNA-binding NarL/FixJ family response regulator